METNHDGPRVRADINVTPLVDVCLVLLIVFMVVGPLMSSPGPPAAPPLARAPGPQPEDRRQLLVSVADPRTVWIGGNPLPQEVFAERMREEFRARPDAPVIVKADRRLAFGDVRRVLLAVRDAGYRDAGLIAEKAP
jgi:biopolymer transport protein ExbD